jgi:hypothetical protein
MLPISRKVRIVLCATSYWQKVNGFFSGAVMPHCEGLCLPGVVFMFSVMVEKSE